jgi:heme A synthase
MVHGWLAQMFLCIVVSLAVTTSPGWRGPRPDVPRHIVAISVGITLLVICQLVLGIVIRHSGPAARPLSSYSVFYWHLGLAASTTVASLALWSSTRASRPGTGLRDRARSLLGLLLVQIALGIAAWWATEAGTGDRSPSLFESWVPTLHVLAGAGVLAYSVALTMHAVAGRATREAALRSSTMEAGVG